MLEPQSALPEVVIRGSRVPVRHSGLKAALLFLMVLLAVAPGQAESSTSSGNTVAIDASKTLPPPLPAILHMGGKSSSGREIGVTSQYLTLDGTPWLPVMGEFHFSRYPEKFWEEEILKMKAGGVRIVSTYIFWIHHEEIEGKFDWSGQRNLRRFVELCARHQMFVFVRVGPWAHGEARNGGLPDWVLKQGPTRRNDPVYLASVRRFYGEIGVQLAGLFWKDGGPILGVQLENEYHESGPDAGAAHISTLKKIAIESGLEAPLFTVTGWDDAIFPAHEVIPVFGAYPDGFWYGDLTELPASDAYLFSLRRVKGQDKAAYENFNTPDEQLSPYPYFVAEGGGGMETAYHRRPLMQPDDIAVNALTQIGSGANLYGYYMFQGGTNPEGKLSTLQESSETGYPNDLPVISYDFQAPLRKYGQMGPSFRRLKLLHLFLNDFGSDLAPMPAIFPEKIPSSPKDEGPPRLAVRSNGDHAFLFMNNYVRQHPLPKRRNFQVALKLAFETVLVPQKPLAIPSDSYFIWPINLDMQGVVLRYSTTQLLCKAGGPDGMYYFFFAVPGIAPEFAFNDHALDSLSAVSGTTVRSQGVVYISGISTGPGSAIRLQSQGKTVHVVVLAREDAENLWKFKGDGTEQVLLTSADVLVNDNSLHLRARDVQSLEFAVFPGPNSYRTASGHLRKFGNRGIFAEYKPEVRSRNLRVELEKIADPATPAPVRMAPPFDWRGGAVAAPPADADFEHAGVWRITIPKNALDGLSDAYLRIRYVGDVGRLYDGTRLVDDDFYKGTVWEVGLKRFDVQGSGRSFTLRLMPLRKNAPLYLPKDAWPDFRSRDAEAVVQSIELVPEHEAVVTGFSERRP